MSRILPWMLLLVLPMRVWAADAVDVQERPATTVTFEADVRPILKAHCWHCHGEDAEVEGGLDARLARLLTKGGESGPGRCARESRGQFALPADRRRRDAARR